MHNNKSWVKCLVRGLRCFYCLYKVIFIKLYNKENLRFNRKLFTIQKKIKNNLERQFMSYKES